MNEIAEGRKIEFGAKYSGGANQDSFILTDETAIVYTS